MDTPDDAGPGEPETSPPSSEEANHSIDIRDPTLYSKSLGGKPSEDTKTRLENSYARYGEFHPLGQGSMALVHACVDPHLGRTVALKALKPDRQEDEEQRSRFVREARVMAQLEHPNIVPVHEMGRDASENIYFTMKRIEGMTLKEILYKLDEEDPEAEKKYTQTRLIDIFINICQAIAFAHSRGVVHRDLKPANILLGPFGEVLVTDWGLAKLIGIDEEFDNGSFEPVQDSTIPSATKTMDGQIAGTPMYMAPEQAMGLIDQIDERTDVYSLGAILYELLTQSYTVHGTTIDDILRQVAHGAIVPPSKLHTKNKIAPELSAICMKALSKNRNQRYPRVDDLIEDLQDFKQGMSVSAYTDSLIRRAWKWCRRHSVASSAVGVGLAVTLITAGALWLSFNVRYRTIMDTADEQKAMGDGAYEQKVAAHKQFEKLRGTHLMQALKPRERELAAQIEQFNRDSESSYQTAVILYMASSDRDVDSARDDALRAIYLNRIKYSVMTRNYDEAEKLLDFIRQWLGADFEEADERIKPLLMQFDKMVRGDGTIQVASNPEGAMVQLFEYRSETDDALEPRLVRDLGPAPISSIPLARGSYLLTFSYPDRPMVRVPVFIEHSEKQSVDVFIPKMIPDGMVYVPAGDFFAAGDEAQATRLHNEYVKGFFVRETEVTFAEYMEYWLAEDGANRSPADMSRVRMDQGSRRFKDAWDAAGNLIDPLQPDWPVVGIKKHSADRYCAWLKKKMGREVRLPTAYEWEKAARGADKRRYVWGNTYNPAYALTLDNIGAKQRFSIFAPPKSFPFDVSVYGVYDLAGNVREWTGSKFGGGSPFYQIKGASAATTRRFLSAAYASDTPVVPSDVGFRYIMPIDEVSDSR